jgi:hypothetical protein
MSNYRNKKLTQSAKNEECVSCGTYDNTIVWAHSNESGHGKGMSLKAHDIFGAYLCMKCHQLFDSNPELINGVSRSTWFRIVWEKSIKVACRKGYL